MQKYLLTIEFDCNDADYVYGTQIITQEQKDIIDRNQNKLISFGSYDFGGAENTVCNCVSVEPITEEEEMVLTKFGFNAFGEGNGFWIENLDSAKESYEVEDYDY